MKKEHAVTITILVAVWAALAAFLHNDILLPSPYQTGTALVRILSSSAAWKAIGATVWRTAEGVLIAAAVSFAVSVCSALSDTFRRYIQPLVAILKTIPNISYIIIALIWLGSEGSSLTVIFMILFPVYLGSFDKAIGNIEERYSDVLKMYPASASEKLRAYILPVLYKDLLATSKTAVSLGFKVGVMSEILGAVRSGIGRSLQYCRTSLDMAGIFAWTVLIILIAWLFEKLFDLLTDLAKRR